MLSQMYPIRRNSVNNYKSNSSTDDLESITKLNCQSKKHVNKDSLKIEIRSLQGIISQFDSAFFKTNPFENNGNFCKIYV